ncbi:MAG TPA: tRNA epoxyqueuosine(34) reductase QueG [Chromatiaceae bacterium]|nr:tRNA epoxyqueuosine(34) reductase QueG [Chromatiaceae bacterium]
MASPIHPSDFQRLPEQIRQWARELGFQQAGITDTGLEAAGDRLKTWLARGFQGKMEYMARHGSKRWRPQELVPGTLRVISVRMDYLPPGDDPGSQLEDPAAAFVSRYALGRDYHKLMRKRLQKLAKRIEQAVGGFGYRVFVDSAPVMEKPLAVKAGLGWMGKHTNLINRDAGSWFFLGELYTDLPLPVDEPVTEHCGDCTACLDLCPTGAIVEPYVVDARRCISYLTIEHPDAIPIELRPRMGNRIYGCDDCLMACPWNRFAKPTQEEDFLPRQGLDTATLLELFKWDEATFLHKTEGSAIRRIGHQRWLRNIAVALGNGPPDARVVKALQETLENTTPLVAEHLRWALQQLKDP